jgi:hypothetical protein
MLAKDLARHRETPERPPFLVILRLASVPKDALKTADVKAILQREPLQCWDYRRACHPRTSSIP